jgi:recombination protein RecR
MDIVDKLTEIFKEFPGIGERQARRFVYFLMSRNGAYAENFALLIKDLKKEVAQCTECFRFFITKNTSSKLCEVCVDANTDSSILMIIEKDSDLESVKKSRIYNGKYFVLGGLVPIVEKTTKSKVRIEELKNKINKEKSILKEIILAFSLNPQGDHTDQYIREELEKMFNESGINPVRGREGSQRPSASNGIKISSLGRGLSTGTELEYSDNDTLKNALKNRQ